MFTVLLHSSKTMKASSTETRGSVPQFIDRAETLARFVGALDETSAAKAMKISPLLAAKTLETMRLWKPEGGGLAIDAFVGDIYSGLQAQSLSLEDRAYANEHLVILSGLYGLLRPLDRVMPYRLEMGYKFPSPYNNLYEFWGDTIARALNPESTIINTSSAEYTKAIFPYMTGARIITPKFLTIGNKTGEPTFVTVHAKIARGAFARWIITNRINDESNLPEFKELGYAFDVKRSIESEPVYVAQTFEGIGMSVRLQ